ncbi:MAG: pyrroline-5-carboxylate reductase [Bacteroidaceae bacterium]
MINQTRIAIIGVGAMGGSIAQGLLRSGNIPASNLWLANPHKEKLSSFQQQGANVVTDNCEAVSHADVIILCVKPWLANQVLEQIKPVMDNSRHTLVSVVAGLSGQAICKQMESKETFPKTLLCLPNTAASVCQSMTFLVPVNTDKNHTQAIAAIFESLGRVMITEERLLPAGMALASCGIAYAMRYARAATEGGVELGIRAHDALQAVLQTMAGAAALLQENGNNPEAEIDKVTTPGGYTIRGLNEMEHAGFSSAVIRGLKASIKQ